jgi:putative endopeptidase
LFKLLGLAPDAALAATKQTYALEKFLADSSRKLEDLRDPYHNYNKMPLAGLSKLAPSVDWKTTFEQMDYKKVDSVVVGQPEYYRAFNKALALYSIDDWKNYIRKNIVNDFSPYLSNAFSDESFRFMEPLYPAGKSNFPAGNVCWIPKVA